MSVWYLDSVFECHEVVESLLLADSGQVDAVVQISQLSGSDGVLTVHLDQSTVCRSPLMRSRRLKHTTLLVLLLMVLLTRLLILLLHNLTIQLLLQLTLLLLLMQIIV